MCNCLTQANKITSQIDKKSEHETSFVRFISKIAFLFLYFPVRLSFSNVLHSIKFGAKRETRKTIWIIIFKWYDALQVRRFYQWNSQMKHQFYFNFVMTFPQTNTLKSKSNTWFYSCISADPHRSLHYVHFCWLDKEKKTWILNIAQWKKKTNSESSFWIASDCVFESDGEVVKCYSHWIAAQKENQVVLWKRYVTFSFHFFSYVKVQVFFFFFVY